MNNHRYTLEPYKGPATRYTCPGCGLKHQFSRYIDTETNQHLADHVGRCNRVHKCQYHVTPKEFLGEFNNQHVTFKNTNRILPTVNRQLSTDFIPEHVLVESMGNYEDNHFISFLKSRYTMRQIMELVNRYKIGTNHYWDSSTVFWQIDIQGRIRTGKVMLYHPGTGKRLKEDGKSYITWMHKVLEYDSYQLEQCMFGEHLLKDSTLPVAIAESEKTAIIASIHLPEYTWLAAGSINNLSVKKCKVLQGRKIWLFPDAGAYNQWAAIAKEIPGCKISPFLEHNLSTDAYQQGYDLADYILSKTG